MKIEIEAKIAVPSLAPLEARLRKMNAVFLKEVRETDLYLKGTHGHPLKRGCGLRLRRQHGPEGEKFFLTFKGPREKRRFKTRQEAEVQISDFEAAKKIFFGLGYTAGIIVRKTRQIWTWKHCHICLDRVPPMGCFVEVEAPTEIEVEEALNRLDLQEKHHLSDGYAKLLAKALLKKKK
ncbi:MAG TPA: class IV adenylate cyclase [Anaerohalosphaeraceae bacterium]|nr:class IV adenylate cyclase [Anaerohalosphaeraceae bacterium]HOL89183.1 class IV adenylate cyclase [Anaerohalosphaeraceae bacterium]HPP57077.1 class IV adenylate cyclase [Anaerohalosphaeraceae bacterium]